MRATGPSPAHATAATAPRTCLAPPRPPQLRPRPRRRTRAPMTRLLWPNARELPLGETRSRTVTRFSPCPSGDLLRARHEGPARTLATTDSAASARGQPQRRDWQADGPVGPKQSRCRCPQCCRTRPLPDKGGRAIAASPTRSRDVRSREDESDRADRGNRTLEIGREHAHASAGGGTCFPLNACVPSSPESRRPARKLPVFWSVDLHPPARSSTPSVRAPPAVISPAGGPRATWSACSLEFR